MPTPTRIRLARYICDIVAIGVGTYCVFEMLLTIKNSDVDFGSRQILMPMTSLLGIIGGLGFGLSESAKWRRFLVAAVLALCAVHFLILETILKAGLYAKCAIPLLIFWIPCILLLLCVVADQLISRRIERQTTLPLFMQFFRLNVGITVALQVTSIAGAVANLPNATSLAWMLIWTFGVVNFAIWFGAYGILFWYMTCPTTPDGMPPLVQRIVVGKLFMAIIAGFVISTLSRVMHSWQSLPDATAIAVLAGCVFFVIAKQQITIKEQNEEQDAPDSLAMPA